MPLWTTGKPSKTKPKVGLEEQLMWPPRPQCVQKQSQKPVASKVRCLSNPKQQKTFTKTKQTKNKPKNKLKTQTQNTNKQKTFRAMSSSKKLQTPRRLSSGFAALLGVAWFRRPIFFCFRVFLVCLFFLLFLFLFFFGCCFLDVFCFTVCLSLLNHFKQWFIVVSNGFWGGVWRFKQKKQICN